MFEQMEADVLAGLTGSAVPAVPLDEEETPVAAGKAAAADLADSIGGTLKTPLIDHSEEMIAEFGDPSAEGLSLLMKLGLAGLILAACYGFVRINSPRSSRSPAGRHGAYEKGGIA